MAIKKKDAAAEIMEHFANLDGWHNGVPGHGYTQGGGRWGEGWEYVTLSDGTVVGVAGGDRDCSSGVISAYQAVGIDCGGATYTGNMSDLMCRTGNFQRTGVGDHGVRGDCVLNDLYHTAMLTGSADGGSLAEFAINEFGGIVGGAVGDQTGNECRIRPYYEFPWYCFLVCVNDEWLTAPEPPASWPVWMWVPNNTPAQRWRVLPSDEDGWFNIVSVVNDLALDVAWGGKEPGTVVQSYRRNGTDAQKWRFEDASGEIGYHPQKPLFIIPKLNTDLALDVQWGSVEQGAYLHVWGKNWTNAQKWVFSDKGDSTMSIINVGGDKALDMQYGGK